MVVSSELDSHAQRTIRQSDRDEQAEYSEIIEPCSRRHGFVSIAQARLADATVSAIPRGAAAPQARPQHRPGPRDTSNNHMVGKRFEPRSGYDAAKALVHLLGRFRHEGSSLKLEAELSSSWDFKTTGDIAHLLDMQMQGFLKWVGLAEIPPHPDFSLRVIELQAGRGDPAPLPGDQRSAATCVLLLNRPTLASST
jgi:hypothetical protein